MSSPEQACHRESDCFCACLCVLVLMCVVVYMCLCALFVTYCAMLYGALCCVSLRLCVGAYVSNVLCCVCDLLRELTWFAFDVLRLFCVIVCVGVKCV